MGKLTRGSIKREAKQRQAKEARERPAKEAKPTTQLVLLQTSALGIAPHPVTLDRLPPDDQLSSPPPSKQLIESIRALGVLDPIAVALDKDKLTYHVIDGRRRVKAFRATGASGSDFIPAVLVEGEGFTPITLGALYHSTRSANPMSDLEIIETLSQALVKEGKLTIPEIEQEVAKATGLAVGTVRARRKLLALEPEFRAAMKTGAVTVTIAEKLAILPAERRANLLPVLAEKGKLTMADVDQERRVGTAEATSQLPWGDFGQMVETPEYTPTEAHEQLAGRVLSEMPAGTKTLSPWSFKVEYGGEVFVVKIEPA